MKNRFGDDKSGNSDALLDIEILPLQYHGMGSGYNSAGEPIYSLLLQPEDMDPKKLGPDELVQVMLTADELNGLIAGAQSVKLGIEQRRRGETN
jgi:hypothetical protein